MKHNIIEKIWQQHQVASKPGFPDVLGIDFALIHEVTSAQAFQQLADKNIPVRHPHRLLATIDHSIPTRNNRDQVDDPVAAKQMATLRDNCKKHGITLHDIDSGHQGIVHVIGPELGVTQPGMTLVCGDSHTATHGAFGALAFGIGTSTLAHVMATGALLMHRPKVMRVHFEGELANNCSAKDMALHLIALLGVGGATGHVIEYTGQAIKSLSMEQRMTLCNMSIECGAIAGLVAPDETTFAYIFGKAHAPKGQQWDQAVKHWRTLISDTGCHYDATVTIHLDTVKPMVTWGTNPAQATHIDGQIPKTEQTRDALAYTQLAESDQLAGTRIDWAFVGSCTNGRIEDLRVVADVLKHNRVANHVTMYIVPGSEQVRKQAQSEGLDHIFEQAGASFRQPGCSMCLAMNDDVVPAGARCISTTNRNFIGRQGTGSITHLASPLTVAHSAIQGHISMGQNNHAPSTGAQA
ncbi:3-isopropylmalate dehydratase large subunit [Marinicella rhabdoformis]|uniref:3-isopropylmalate dehydratase large subunit n=1 Tax=Marinicella rhabdoformis TaxID=2580566 RepID=UPI0012AEBA8E|nr:3-isopropylmalate dehydratase large subunit [Marinicella rhabdoformis]